MLIALLLAVQDPVLIPDGYEIVTGPFYDGKNVRFVARNKESGSKIVQIGKTTHDYLKVIVITDGKTGLDVVTGFDKIENPVFVDGQLLSYEAKRVKSNFVVIKGEKFEIPEGRQILAKQGAMYVLPKGPSKCFVVGEKYKGPDADGVDGFRVSPDGKLAMYKAKFGEEEALMIDTKKITGLQFWEWGWSPSGEPYFVSSTKTKDGGMGELTLTVAGKKGPPLRGSIGEVKFAPDGRTPVMKMFDAVDGKQKSYFVFQNRLLPGCDEVDSPCVSPDGKNLAFRAKIGTNVHIVMNDRKGPGFTEVGSVIAWSGDSKKVAYAAKVGTKWTAVDGEKTTGEWDQITWVGYPPKSGTLAYVGVREQAYHLVEGKTESAALRLIGTPRFGADGTLWYDGHDGAKYMLFRGKELATDSTGPILYLGLGAWQMSTNGLPGMVLPDGKAGPFDVLSMIRADGKAIVFVGSTKEKQTVYIGSRAVHEAEQIYDVRPVDDGKKLLIFFRQGIELAAVKVPFDPPKKE